LDGGIVRKAQADSATLTVDLDNGDLNVIALVENFLNCFDAVTRAHIRDVEQPVGSLGKFDEGTECGGLHDLACERVAKLNFLRHRSDALCECVTKCSGCCVDQNLAVVFDGDLSVELFLECADRLPTLADD